MAPRRARNPPENVSSMHYSPHTLVRLGLTAFAAAILTAGATPAAAQTEIVLTAKGAAALQGDWQLASDASAADGVRLWNPDRGAGKLPGALASPRDYVEFSFQAEAGRGYRLWIRGKADDDAWTNDSVFVQFDRSVTSSGAAVHRIGTTSAAIASIEACSGCGLYRWGWEDTKYGGAASPIYFAVSGTQRLRVQRREDGVSLDQIVLSAGQYLHASPGATKGDSTILSGAAPAPTTSGSTSTTGSTTGSSLVLRDSSATVLRGGRYGHSNFGSQALLETRVSSDDTYTRRIQLKFDTHTTIPAGTAVTSAHLTLTVAGGNAETRQLTAYRGAYSYNEWEATWYARKSGVYWPRAGGDTGEVAARQSVTSTPGSKVTFDVTGVVQKIVSGQYGGSRYARFLIADMGGSSRDGYKQYHSDEASDPAVRPVLTVTLGSSGSTTSPAPAPAPAPAPSAPSGSGTRLRVLQWNLHHGVGTDGRYDPDRIATWMARFSPDVILLNEVEKYTSWGNEDQPARYKALLESKTGRRWYSHFSQEFGQWSSSGKGHQILSRYPLDAVGHTTITPSSGLRWAGAVSQATITVNGRTVNFFLTHLDPYDQSMRLTQARDVIRWAAGYAENRILAGDMNAWPDQSSIAEFNRTYADSWTVAAASGTATGISGISPFGATKKGRIDYIFFSKSAPHLVVLDSKTPDTRDSAGHMPSDHRPLLTTFEVR